MWHKEKSEPEQRVSGKVVFDRFPHETQGLGQFGRFLFFIF